MMRKPKHIKRVGHTVPYDAPVGRSSFFEACYLQRIFILGLELVVSAQMRACMPVSLIVCLKLIKQVNQHSGCECIFD